MRRLLPCLMLLAGCAAAPAPPTEYLLHAPLADVREVTVQGAYEVALGRIDVAPYLDRDGIVVETADRRVTAATEHRWAEPLPHALRRLLQVVIAREINAPVAAEARRGAGAGLIVDVGVQRFHGSVDGRVVLVADWTVRRPRDDRIIAHHQLVRETLTRADGYDALVQAQIALAEQLGEAVAESLSQITSR